MLISPDNLYIVADGRHFIMLSNKPSNAKNHLKALKKIQFFSDLFDDPHRKNSSHVFDRMGIARSNQSGINPKDKASEMFLKKACKEIDYFFKDGAYKRLVLIAKSDVMEILKRGMSKNMRKKIFHEIFKDYSNTSINELEKVLLNQYALP